MSVTKPKVLLVGGGLTSAVLATFLADKKVEVVVWDKAGRTGGRMTSHRRVDGQGQVDLGAQYITATPTYKNSHDGFYKELISAGLLRSLVSSSNNQLVDKITRTEIGERVIVEARKKTGVSISLDDKFWEEPFDSKEPVNLVRSSNYVAPLGAESIVNYFWRKSGLDVKSSHPLQQLDKVEEGWVAKSDRKEEQFNCVVTTLPVPQLLGESPAPEGVIGGNFLDIIKKDKPLFNNLSSVKYNTVFCLGLFYDTTLHEKVGFNWKAKYFPLDPVVRYISIDNLKRGDLKSPTTISVQCQVSYSMENRHKSKGEMANLMMEHLVTLLPNLPPPSSILSHKWRYSQTSKPYPGEPGCVLLHNKPPLISAGDSFTHSNMDGCILSARITQEMVCQMLGIKG